jgi:hypothetical protein
MKMKLQIWFIRRIQKKLSKMKFDNSHLEAARLSTTKASAHLLVYLYNESFK